MPNVVKVVSMCLLWNWDYCESSHGLRIKPESWKPWNSRGKDQFNWAEQALSQQRPQSPLLWTDSARNDHQLMICGGSLVNGAGEGWAGGWTKAFKLAKETTELLCRGGGGAYYSIFCKNLLVEQTGWLTARSAVIDQCVQTLKQNQVQINKPVTVLTAIILSQGEICWTHVSLNRSQWCETPPDERQHPQGVTSQKRAAEPCGSRKCSAKFCSDRMFDGRLMLMAVRAFRPRLLSFMLSQSKSTD